MAVTVAHSDEEPNSVTVPRRPPTLGWDAVVFPIPSPTDAKTKITVPGGGERK